MKQISKNKLAFCLLASLILTLTWAFASEDVSRSITQNITRLHIVANSDSADDQALKLTIRNRLLAEVKNSDVSLNDEEILRLCYEEIEKSSMNYAAKIERGTFYFPQKTYENITLPAGEYNAVRIVLGKGTGQNWWCVMYPPLCFSAEGNGFMNDNALEELKKSMSPESFKAITESDSITIKPGFKLLELWQELKAKL